MAATREPVRLALRQLWSDHVIWTRLYIIAAVNGNRLAEWALIAQLSPGMLKGMNRATLARAAMPQCDAWFRRHQWTHATWPPLATWIWLVALLSSAFGNTIEWRGYRYKLQRRRTV